MPIPQERDMDAISQTLATWISEQEGVSDASVTNLAVPEESGFSNETILGDIKYLKDGEQKEHGIVIRKRPSGGYAVFPEYNMALQHRCMSEVKKLSDVPVPDILWTEDSGEVLGDPFFVMNRLYGKVPPDNPPYFQEGFVFEATPKEQGILWASTVETLAAIAAIDWQKGSFREFLDQPQYGPLGFEQQLGYYKSFLEMGAEGRPQPTLEAALEFFVNENPVSDMPEQMQLLWGDARPSNIMYGDDFRPIGVFDWEMATIGPGEVDLGWHISMSKWQQSTAEGSKWLPGFPEQAETVAIYEKAAGRKVHNIDYFVGFGYFRFCVIMIRIIAMQIAFGFMGEEMRVYERVNPAVEMLANHLGLPKPE